MTLIVQDPCQADATVHLSLQGVRSGTWYLGRLCGPWNLSFWSCQTNSDGGGGWTSPAEWRRPAAASAGFQLRVPASSAMSGQLQASGVLKPTDEALQETLGGSLLGLNFMASILASQLDPKLAL